jgi:hypothetical protein
VLWLLSYHVLKKIGWTCCFGEGGARARVGHKPDLHGNDQIPLLTPVRPVVTRWNSYHAAIERATKLYSDFNRYMEHHIKSVAFNKKRSGSACKDVPAWMRQGGLAAND